MEYGRYLRGGSERAPGETRTDATEMVDTEGKIETEQVTSGERVVVQKGRRIEMALGMTEMWKGSKPKLGVQVQNMGITGDLVQGEKMDLRKVTRLHGGRKRTCTRGVSKEGTEEVARSFSRGMP